MEEPLSSKTYTLQEAYAYCVSQTKHYENFPVGSCLLPKLLRPHVAAVYAFARAADDFADEAEYEESRMARLKEWENALKSMGEGATHPVFMALHDTVKRFQIPVQLFEDLLKAFKMDVVVRRYYTFDQVLQYCRYSANPVGRIILHLMGYPAPKLMEYSDSICTALQLANFWQDVALDLEKDRIYLPADEITRFSYSEDALKTKCYNSAFRRLILFQVERTKQFFEQGRPLCGKIRGRFGLELRLTWLGGMEILKKIGRVQGNVFEHRPQLKKRDFFRLGLHALRRGPFVEKIV